MFLLFGINVFGHRVDKIVQEFVSVLVHRRTKQFIVTLQGRDEGLRSYCADWIGLIGDLPKKIT